jgi:hypothetical protein
VYIVPFEAVTTNGYGEDIIYVAALQGDGSYITEELLVTTGMVIDRRVEISSEALTDGVLVVRSARGIHTGAVVVPQRS